MNAQTEVKNGLAKLREPFPDNQISKLPKPTKRQTDEVKADFKKGIRCKLCGAWHHPDVVHLDYVGHAALTDRLLECDPAWNWEPMAVTPNGAPEIDGAGGMWIKLTVCGVTRLGYGHPDGKTGGDAIKETIGDALRNAAMRFGAALDLWHKGDLHAHEGDDEGARRDPPPPRKETPPSEQEVSAAVNNLKFAGTLDQLRQTWAALSKPLQSVPDVITAKDTRKAALEAPQPTMAEQVGDEIPY